MSEVTFAKQFLTVLDSKPQKLASDYVADPKKLPSQPAFILPRTSKPFHKSTSNPQLSRTTTSDQVKITLSPLRKTADSPEAVTITVASKNSVYDLKTQLGSRTGYAPDKLKLLWERKPLADMKILYEVIGNGVSQTSLAVMYSGAPTASRQAAEDSTTNPISTTAADTSTTDVMDVDRTPVAQGQSGGAVLATSQFWEDLQEFVLQRVRDEPVGREAVAVFEKAWKSR